MRRRGLVGSLGSSLCVQQVALMIQAVVATMSTASSGSMDIDVSEDIVIPIDMRHVDKAALLHEIDEAVMDLLTTSSGSISSGDGDVIEFEVEIFDTITVNASDSSHGSDSGSGSNAGGVMEELIDEGWVLAVPRPLAGNSATAVEAKANIIDTLNDLVTGVLDEVMPAQQAHDFSVQPAPLEAERARLSRPFVDSPLMDRASFVWQGASSNDDELWPLQLSVLSTLSGTALLLVGVLWVRIRRHRRRLHQQDDWVASVEMADQDWRQSPV